MNEKCKLLKISSVGEIRNTKCVKIPLYSVQSEEA